MKRIVTILLLQFSFLLNAQIGFQSHQIVNETNFTENNEDIELADLDNDGDLDILSASWGDDKITWYENLDGLGTFSNQIILSDNTTGAKVVKAVDIDNDGDLDVVTSQLAWFENLDGEGNFGPENIIDNYTGQSIFDVADIDGDGDFDIVSARNNLQWYENMDGLGNFSNANLIISSIQLYSISAIDFNGDDAIDLLLNRGYAVSWIENINGQGNFGTENIINDNLYISEISIPADVDSDGNMDVIVSADNWDLVWHKNIDGLGNFGPEILIDGLLENPKDINIGDVDADGDMDIISLSFNQDTVVWYENLNGLGAFGNVQTINDEPDRPSAVEFGDIDGDGALDAVFCSRLDNRIAWHKNQDGLGDFSEEMLVNNGLDRITGVLFSDFNGDGDIDILTRTTNYHKLSWFKSDVVSGSYSFSQKLINENYGGGLRAFFKADFDGDDDDDILLAHGNFLFWFQNEDGLGNFSAPIEIASFPTRLEDVSMGDVDGDGDMDIVCAKSFSEDKIFWLENIDGLGTFSSENIISTNFLDPNNLLLSDIDGDGDLDVISSALSSSGSIAWFENLDGQGNYSSKIIIEQVDLGYAGKISDYDMDGDGDLDLVTSSNIDSNVAWYENLDGEGTFGPANIVNNVPVSTNQSAAVDIDTDGDLDIVATDGGDLIMFENLDGLGNFGSKKLIIEDGSINYFDIYDVDGDGLSDFVTGGGNFLSWQENLGPLKNIIYGKLLIDANSDGCDINDLVFPDAMVVTSNGANTFATFSNEDGEYVINTNEGEFATAVTSALPIYYSSNPASHTHNFNGLGNTYEANFCIEPSGNVNDLTISLYPLSDARPGFDAQYQLHYANIGTTVLSGTVNLFFNEDGLTLIEATEPIDNQTGNSVSFNYQNIEPFESRTINITFNVAPPPTVEIDDVLLFEAEITPIVDDFNEEDNNFVFEQIVVGSFDPNDIRVLEGEEITIYEVDNYLHYIIRFQNTGTAEAQNIKVTNELDSNLDWTTLQLEDISHHNRVEISDGALVEFIFDNIQLPDINTNEPESHGYIAYKIKPKSNLGLGDSMSNNANIFFDFNPPIETNTVTTTIIESLGVEESALDTVKVYPVPAENMLMITATSRIVEATIYNQLGQEVLSFSSNGTLETLSISTLSSGFYTLKLTDEFGATAIKKIIKE
ncbi:T9SS type A sorting domain-containing protein [Rasiella sp. SM2506]|uniref:T9SS type A sorting domain-containing protein n=1 Tax=Rasiella sp. SM2506 TaxID=3423914 RepID=UPI003D7B7C79